MIKTAELYEFAQSRNIDIIFGKLQTVSALAFKDDFGSAVVIDQAKIISAADEKTKAGHEIGHCETGAFYTLNSLETRSRCEYRADKWAIKKLLPLDELTEAMKNGCTEVWQIAEHFGVTEDFVKKAVWIYFDKEV